MRFAMRAAGFAAAWIVAVACVPCAFAEGAAKAVDAATLCKSEADANATPVERPPARYPRDQLEQEGDGWVSLMLTVAEDGAVRDLVVLDSIGAPSFRTAAVDAVRRWRYRPVLSNGKPVAHYGVSVDVSFTTRAPSDRGSSPAVVGLWATLKTRKFSDAETYALMLPSQDWPLGFRDRTLMAFGLALAARDIGDWRMALYHIRHAQPVDLAKADELRKEGMLGANDVGVAAAVMRLRAQLEAQDGNLRDAVCRVEQVKASKEPGPANDPAAAAAADALARINDPQPLTITGVVFAQRESDLPPAWVHTLLRPTFSFAEITGAVKSFRLVCPDAVIEQDVKMGQAWTAPGNARGCRLFVFGDAGTSIKLVETR